MSALRIVAAALPADLVIDPNSVVTVDWEGMHGQTSVFRVSLPVPPEYGGYPLSVTATVMDSYALKGSGGVFSGFDLDFILFSYDSEFDGNTFGASSSLFLSSGVAYYPSPYTPTLQNPGPLFGLDANGELRSDVATLWACDANYRAGVASFTVDTSWGWVSLGDGGGLRASYDLPAGSGGMTLYMYLGDAGQHDEDPLVGVELVAVGIPEPGTHMLQVIKFLDVGGEGVAKNDPNFRLAGWHIDVDGNDLTHLDANTDMAGETLFGPLNGAVSWRVSEELKSGWSFTGAWLYNDANGAFIGHISDPNAIYVDLSTMDVDVYIGNIPEPGTIVLMAAGCTVLAAAARRRRARR